MPKPASKPNDTLSEQALRDWKTQKHTRSAMIEKRAVDEESRTVELAFSSEEPYERWFGMEILDHKPSSVRMGRLKNGAALLVNHNTDDHVGVIESARIDGDSVGRAVVRFGRGARASEIFADVVDGIRTQVSVGYIVHEMILEKSSDDQPPIYRVTDFEPLEISLVAVPADPTVGVGRHHDKGHYPMPKKTETPADESIAGNETRQQQPDSIPAAAPQQDSIDRDAELKAIREAELERCRQIDSLAGTFPFLAEKARQAKEEGTSVAEFQSHALVAMKQRTEQDPRSYSESRIEMSHQIPRGKLKAFTKSREGLEQAYRAGMWARAVLFGDDKAARWCRDYAVRVMTGTSSGTASVVPEEMIMPIIDLREQYGVARSNARIIPMGSDTATVPRRVSGVTAYFPGRTEATTASDAAFDDVNLVAREVSALTRLSKAYAQDAVIDLGDHLANEMAYAFAVKEDDCLFNGDGTSTYGGIYGIRPKIIDGNHTAGAVDAASGIDTFAEVTIADLVNVSGALPMFPGINAAWYISKRGNALVFDDLKATGGGNTTLNLSAGAPPTWLGDEIVISQSMPSSTGDLSNVAMIVYGDLDMGVTFGDRMGFEVDVLTERYAEFRQIGVIATERMDIVVHGLGDTSTAGPIVALIGE